MAAVQGLISYGPQVPDALDEALSNLYLSYPIRKQLPEVIAAFNNQKAVDVLSRHRVDTDIGMRYEVIRSLNRLRIRSGALMFYKTGLQKINEDGLSPIKQNFKFNQHY